MAFQRDEELAALRIRYRDCIAENDLLYEVQCHTLCQRNVVSLYIRLSIMNWIKCLIRLAFSGISDNVSI